MVNIYRNTHLQNWRLGYKKIRWIVNNTRIIRAKTP
jgi:hypothetical protein